MILDSYGDLDGDIMNNSQPIDSLFISKRRPRHSVISFFTKNYQVVLGLFVTTSLVVTVLPYEIKYTSIAIICYWCYLLLKYRFVKSESSRNIYNSDAFSVGRAILLALGITIYLAIINTSIVTTKINYPIESLWLLYLLATFISSQRGDTKYLVILLIICIFCLTLVTPPLGIYILGINLILFNTYFISRVIWLVTLAFVLHTVSRYLGDYSADLKVIQNVQGILHKEEDQVIDSPEAHNFQENHYLQQAVERIATDLQYPHVLIFIKDSSGQIKTVAGSCIQGKALASDGYIIDAEISIVKHVIETGHTYFIQNVHHPDPYYYPHPSFKDTKSELVVPLFEMNKVIGCIDIESNQNNIFLSQDIEVIEILSRYLGSALHNARMHKRREKINNLVKSIASRFLTEFELYGTLKEITRIANDELGSDIPVLYERDPTTGRITGPVISGKLIGSSLDSTYLDDESVINKLIYAKDNLYIHQNVDELINDPLLSPSSYHLSNSIPTFIQREKIESNAIVRLLHNGECIGLLFVNYRSPKVFSDWDKENLSTLADLAELAIQKEQSFNRLLQSERENHAIDVHDALKSTTLGISYILSSLLNSNSLSIQDRNDIERAFEGSKTVYKDILWIQGIFKENFSGNLFTDISELVKFSNEIYDINIKSNWTGNKYFNNPIISVQYMMILREALNNAIRHGKATEIIVNTIVNDNCVTMVIIDNGIGFDVGNLKSKSGLHNMEVRMEKLNGNININSTPSQGCTIQIDAPITHIKE